MSLSICTYFILFLMKPDIPSRNHTLKFSLETLNFTLLSVINMCCHCQEELRKNASFWSIFIHLNYAYFRFVHSLSACLHQLCGYRALMEEVEALRATAYNADNLEHEQSLLQLWSLLQPGIPLMTRKTKQWQNIGFQGEDPKTDFRGMGILGLENLL